MTHHLTRNEVVALLADGTEIDHSDVNGGAIFEARWFDTHHIHFHVLFDPIEPEAKGYLLRRHSGAGTRLDILDQFNGAVLFDGFLVLGGAVVRGSWLGSPISLDYGNIVERPANLPRDHFVIGGYSGDSRVAALTMTPDGAVHCWDGNSLSVVRSWPSFRDMMRSEIRRLSAAPWRDHGLRWDELLPGGALAGE